MHDLLTDTVAPQAQMNTWAAESHVPAMSLHGNSGVRASVMVQERPRPRNFFMKCTPKGSCDERRPARAPHRRHGDREPSWSRQNLICFLIRTQIIESVTAFAFDEQLEKLAVDVDRS